MNPYTPPPPPPPLRVPPPPQPLKQDGFISELPYLRSHVLPPPPPPPFPRPPSAGPHVNGASRSPDGAPPPVPARPPALRRPKTAPGVPQDQIPPPPPRLFAIAHEAHPHLDIAGPTDYVRQRVHSRALPQPGGVTTHAPAIPSKALDGWNPPSYGGMAQQIVGASFRIPVENEAAVRRKEEMLAQQRAFEEDRIRMQAIAAEERRLEEEAARERKRRQEEEETRITRERREAEKREAEKREAEKREAEKREAEKREAERREAEKREAERREAERREAERREAERREAERLHLEAEEAERIRKEVEAAERLRLEREAEAQRKAEEEAQRKKLEQERKEQWEREERERKERWERDEAERIRWLMKQQQMMDDERMAQLEAMREEMRMEFQKQKTEFETAAATAQLEAEETARKRERELQEQRDAELAKLIAEETQDPSPAPSPAPSPGTPRQAVDAGPVQQNAPLPSYEELDSGRLSPPAPIRHSPSPRSRVLPLPPMPPTFPAPQLSYHEPFQPPSMGNPPGPSSTEGARTPLRRSPIRQPIELPPENPVFRTVSPPMNGHIHGSESFDHTHFQHRPPNSNPNLNRNAISLGGANPGRAPPPRIGGFNPHQPRPSPPMPARRLTPEETLPIGARPGMAPIPGAPWPVSNVVPNAPGSSAGPSQSLYPSAIQASGPGPGPASGSGAGSGSGSGSRPAHYGDPPPDGVSGILFGYGRPVIQVFPLPAPRAIDPVLILDPTPGKPFHVVAHSWQHLLRFLASCASSRVEPSPAAMAREKTSPRLRVVLHFVRLPAGDWRIVLYFALDSVEKAPDGYPSWNTTVLPYNFPAPEPGKPMVHTEETQIYTITTQPLPVLPLALPNLTPYLQAALDESRQTGGSDSRSRLKGLVHATENCKPVGQFERPGLLSVIGMSGSGSSSSGGSGNGAPPVNNTQVEIGGPSKLSRRRDDSNRPGFFSKLLGKNKNQGGVNDETFVRITPFHADEYQ